MVTRNEVLKERWRREQVTIGSKGAVHRALRTRLKFHWGAGSQTGGYKFYRLLRNLAITGKAKKSNHPRMGKRKSVTASQSSLRLFSLLIPIDNPVSWEAELLRLGKIEESTKNESISTSRGMYSRYWAFYYWTKEPTELHLNKSIPGLRLI